MKSKVLFLGLAGATIALCGAAKAKPVIPRGEIGLPIVTYDQCKENLPLFGGPKGSSIILSCFLNAISRVQVDGEGASAAIGAGYDNWIEAKLKADWQANPIHALGVRDGYVPVRFERMSIAQSGVGLGRDYNYFGCLVSAKGDDVRKTFYMLTFRFAYSSKALSGLRQGYDQQLVAIRTLDAFGPELKDVDACAD